MTGPLKTFRVRYQRTSERLHRAVSIEAAAVEMQRLSLALGGPDAFKLMSIEDVTRDPTYADAVWARQSKDGVDCFPTT